MALDLVFYVVCRSRVEKWDIGTELSHALCLTFCGAEGIRTPDFCLAKAALYQLSYGPGDHHCSDGSAHKACNLHAATGQESEEGSVIKRGFGPHNA